MVAHEEEEEEGGLKTKVHTKQLLTLHQIISKCGFKTVAPSLVHFLYVLEDIAVCLAR